MSTTVVGLVGGLAAGIAAVALGATAHAVNFYSVGSMEPHVRGFDPGVGPRFTDVVSFDAAPAWGIVETRVGDVGVYTGNAYRHGNQIAANPMGDKSAYEAVGPGGSATFDFAGYLLRHKVDAISFYWGSIDSYNILEILDRSGGVIATITGDKLPRHNGNQIASMTNRRVYIDVTPEEHFGGLKFLSNGVAFEYDDIAVEATSIVPEPSTWAMLVGGFGLIGCALRRKARGPWGAWSGAGSPLAPDRKSRAPRWSRPAPDRAPAGVD